MLALALAGGACGDSKDDDSGSDEQAAEDALKGDCAAISAVCHQADEGGGAAHVCHELAHANVVSECTAQKESCESTCAAALADGGAAESDAAAHQH